VTYVEADVSMILTRAEGWSEVKVGRIFKSSDCLHAEGKPGSIIPFSIHSQFRKPYSIYKNDGQPDR